STRWSPIPPIIKGISAENRIFGRELMVHAGGEVVFIRRTESGVVIFRDSLDGIRNPAVRQRPERIHIRSYRRDGGCSCRRCRHQACCRASLPVAPALIPATDEGPRL